jgi:Zn-dependent protease
MPGDRLSGLVQFFAAAALPILFGITLHEVAHGWMARRFGDRTAEMLGRLTVNPLKHIDPLGTVVVPLLMAWLGGFIFGWAKPVPVNPRNLRNPKKSMIAVAAAGPAANLLMALAWALLLRVLLLGGTTAQTNFGFFVEMARIGVFFNVLLAVFNLFPIPPLDGGRVLRGLVPESIGNRLDAVEPFGLIILVALLALGLLGPILWPLIRVAQDVVFAIVGL